MDAATGVAFGTGKAVTNAGFAVGHSVFSASMNNGFVKALRGGTSAALENTRMGREVGDQAQVVSPLLAHPSLTVFFSAKYLRATSLISVCPISVSQDISSKLKLNKLGNASRRLINQLSSEDGDDEDTGCAPHTRRHGTLCRTVTHTVSLTHVSLRRAEKRDDYADQKLPNVSALQIRNPAEMHGRCNIC